MSSGLAFGLPDLAAALGFAATFSAVAASSAFVERAVAASRDDAGWVSLQGEG